MSCGVGCRRGSDPVLLWLWHRLVATALIGSLAWEPPYAMGAAQEMAKRQKKKVYSAIVKFPVLIKVKFTYHAVQVYRIFTDFLPSINYF